MIPLLELVKEIEDKAKYDPEWKLVIKQGEPLYLATIDKEEILRITSTIRKMINALELTATPKDLVHTVFPKCLCSPCLQKELLTELGL